MAEDNEFEDGRLSSDTEDGFTYYLHQLRQAAFMLRALGVILAVGTVIAILWAPAVIARMERYSFSNYFFSWALLIGFNVLIALAFETLRKRGDAIFEELSDEFQWHLGGDKRRSAEIGPSRPPINLRVTLRSFLSAGDLLLAPGRFGPLFYSIINVALFLLGAVFRWQK